MLYILRLGVAGMLPDLAAPTPGRVIQRLAGAGGEWGMLGVLVERHNSFCGLR